MKRKLRIWWIAQIPGKSFYKKEVDTLWEAKLILDTLAEYDSYLIETNNRPDYCNAGGLQEYNEEAGQWYDWSDEDGYDIDEHFSINGGTK